MLSGAAMGLCERLGDWALGLVLMTEMRAERCAPDVVSFSALLSCCEAMQRPWEVPRLLAELQRFIL